MAKGKRLAKKQHKSHSQQNMVSIAEILDHSFPGGNAANITIENVFLGYPHSSDGSNNSATNAIEYAEERKASSTLAKYGWIQCVGACTTCVICFAVIASLYDYINLPAVLIGGAFLSLWGIIPALASWLGWQIQKPSAKLSNFFTPLIVGLLLAIVLSVCLCGYMGFRLSRVPTATESDPSSDSTIESMPVLTNNGDSATTITPTPIETPSPSFEGIEDNADTTNPIIITPHPSETNEGGQRIQADFFLLIYYDNDSEHTQFIADDMNVWRATFVNEIKKMIGTERKQDVPNEVYREFESKTQAANNLYGQLVDRPDQIVAIDEIIQLREEAYKLYPTLSLCDLLAEDYLSLAMEYKRINDQENTYQSYYNAAMWKLTSTHRLTQIDDSFYDALYFIATVYHGIGNSEWLSNKERIDAHYISACLFGAASQNTFSNSNEQYLSCVYTGMANHNLLNLNSPDAPSESAIYFLESYAYYTKALEFPSKDKKRIYGYLNHICTWAEQHSKTYQDDTILQEPSVYRELAEKYKRLSL